MFALASLVKERSVTMPLVTLLILRGLQSSRRRLFWQLPVIIAKRDTGWFNEFHFMKMPNITDKVKKLLVNTKGHKSKMA